MDDLRSVCIRMCRKGKRVRKEYMFDSSVLLMNKWSFEFNAKNVCISYRRGGEMGSVRGNKALRKNSHKTVGMDVI